MQSIQSESVWSNKQTEIASGWSLLKGNTWTNCSVYSLGEKIMPCFDMLATGCAKSMGGALYCFTFSHLYGGACNQSSETIKQDDVD